MSYSIQTYIQLHLVYCTFMLLHPFTHPSTYFHLPRLVWSMPFSRYRQYSFFYLITIWSSEMFSISFQFSLCYINIIPIFRIYFCSGSQTFKGNSWKMIEDCWFHSNLYLSFTVGLVIQALNSLADVIQQWFQQRKASGLLHKATGQLWILTKSLTADRKAHKLLCISSLPQLADLLYRIHLKGI